MWNVSELVMAFIISSITTLLVTPIIIKVAVYFDAVDRPNQRKIHNGIKPSMGGLAIFFGAAAGFIYLMPSHEHMTAIVIGAFIMLLTGIFDDIFEIRALYKLAGQIAAGLVVVSSGLVIEKITLPFFGLIYLDYTGAILTVLWIVAVSNAINLIDGLDGLAAGVSVIGFSSLLVMAIIDYRIVVVYLAVILIGSSVGFLYHNFYPAKIFMGDTGSMFLGYGMAILSILGLFKNVALLSFIIPIIVIAVPVIDTVYAIVRRTKNNRGIAMADKEHLHYQLMKMGYTHRKAVLIIYAFSIFFGVMAILVNSATFLASLGILLLIALGIRLIAELSGITLSARQPLLEGIRRVTGIRRG